MDLWLIVQLNFLLGFICQHTNKKDIAGYRLGGLGKVRLLPLANLHWPWHGHPGICLPVSVHFLRLPS